MVLGQLILLMEIVNTDMTAKIFYGEINLLAYEKRTYDLLNQVGGETAELIKDFAKDLDNPKNNPFTIKEKGFDDPLIDSGKMVGSIDYEIE